ncbi:hypothetical protein KV097_02465 [Mumia sp. zg.B17]|uniref:hypothetical protein n=1 Tax=Mumia sp. zg.B17 TaxID=2855446 RepID=UPI001C6F3624|nr:hypothetical protein [Mumia sp. zg.B17]MBW9204792.1 hypothetical protein [Mumia sp. zg.B17]
MTRIAPALAVAAALTLSVLPATAHSSPATATAADLRAGAPPAAGVVAAAAERAKPRLRVTVRDRSRSLAPGQWTKIRVKVRNTGRTTARSVRVRVAKRSGLTVRPSVRRLGSLRAGKSRTTVVRVRLDVTARRTVKISARARAARTRTTTVSIAPRATTWTGSLQPGGTRAPLSFTMSADGRTIRNFTVKDAPCSCWWPWVDPPLFEYWLGEIVVPTVPVSADGTVNAEVALPADPGLTKTVKIRGTVRSGKVTDGAFSYDDKYDDQVNPPASCWTDPHTSWTATGR